MPRPLAAGSDLSWAGGSLGTLRDGAQTWISREQGSCPVLSLWPQKTEGSVTKTQNPVCHKPKVFLVVLACTAVLGGKKPGQRFQKS